MAGLIGEHDSLYHEIAGDNCKRLKTTSGKLELSKWISSPINTVDVIEKRQKQIEWLIDNAEKRKELQNLCTQFATIEQNVSNSLEQATIDAAALVKNNIIDAHTLLTTRLKLMSEGFIQWKAKDIATSVIFSSLATTYRVIENLILRQTSLQQGINRLYSEPFNSFKDQFPKKESMKLFMRQLTGIDAYDAFKKRDWTAGSLSLLKTAGAYGFSYLTYRFLTNQYTTSQHGLRERRIITCIDELYKALTLYQTTNKFLGTTQSPKIEDFIKDMEHAHGGDPLTRSARKIAVFTKYVKNEHLGRILLDDSKTHVITSTISYLTPIKTIFEEIAYTDACCAAAGYFDDLKKKNIPVCKATFKMKTDTADLSLKNAVHPLIARYKNYKGLIANDFIFSDKARNQILTSHNSSGKSGALGTALLNVILAQTFGYALCEEYTGTIFDHLAIHKKIDETAQLSTGGAQGVSIIDLNATINKAATNKEKVFIILDEPCSGSSNEIASEILLNEKILGLFKTLDKNTNVASYIATHFRLDTKDLKSFAQYHMKVTPKKNLNEQYTFDKTYKIEPGPGIWLSEKEEDKKIVNAYMEAWM